MTHRSHEPLTAVFPGSFNPFTRGHMSVALRALEMFDRLVIGVGFSPVKPASEADARQRAEAIGRLFAGNPRVEAVAWAGLTVDLCRSCGARVIVRGIRSVADFEYERNLADVNRRIGDGIETVVLFTLPEDSAVSSSMVRELESYGVDVAQFLPTPPSKQ